MQTNDLKYYKILKFIQLFFLITTGIISFLLLVLNPYLSANIFEDKSLFTLCFIVWVLLIVSFLFLLLDFSRLETMISVNHALHKTAYLDNLTGIPNRHSCDLIFESYAYKKNIHNVGCCVLTIKNLLDINRTRSHEEGDAIIQDFCNILENVGDRFGFVGRNGGNEFLVVLESCTEHLIQEFIKQLLEELDVYNHIHNNKIEVLYEYALNIEEKVTRFSDLVAICCRKMEK